MRWAVACLTVWLMQAQAAVDIDAYPSPDISPGRVVELQMHALRHNDLQNSGIAVAFRFASPANKHSTGPLTRFITMLRSDGYAAMLNHLSVDYAPVEQTGDRAVRQVQMMGPDQRAYTLIFYLSRQISGDCIGCWMTDAVTMRASEENLWAT